jgi:hypothetical protein
MKTSAIKLAIILSGILLSILISSVCLMSCHKDDSDKPLAGDDIPALNSLNRDSLGMGNLGSVIYTVDPSLSDTATFDPNSESYLNLFVSDANGYEWMLSIPPHGLMQKQLITMTAFSMIDVSQTGARIRSGVQLEPDGIQFLDKVFLSVNTPDEKPGTAQFFTFNQDGSHVEFAETYSWESGGGGLAKIWHFSGAGYDDSQKSGSDVTDLYNKWAKEDYELGMIAANMFLKEPTPTPPEAPSISQFCRGFNKDQIDVELYEYMHYFLEPYEDITQVIMNAIYRLQSTGDDYESKKAEGFAACLKIYQKAEQSLYQLGATYEGKKPPDQLYALINVGLCIAKSEVLISADEGADLRSKSMSWAQIIRDYYLDTELKKNHDYRAFQVLLGLNKEVQLLEGTDRLKEIFSAMTFKLTIDTKFDAKWEYSSDSYDMGNVVQHGVIKMSIEDEQITTNRWGEADNLSLAYTSGEFTFHKTSKNGTFPAAGLIFKGSAYLLNLDPCLTNTFDVLISDFGGDEVGTNSLTVAGSSAMVCFRDYHWSASYIFSVPIKNQNATLGDATFSASGSAADGDFTGNGEVHITIEHTPE